MSAADNLQFSAEDGHRRDSAGRISRVVKKKGELLTDSEKKANHIVSEQKRRQNIRTGYDQLIQIVPTLTPSQRSEALILQKTVEYIKYLLMEREILEGQVKNV
ncbi:Transcription factor [Coemansia sp. RSA 1365]|nr:Transcription factor [Coemansia sp. RSA 1365]